MKIRQRNNGNWCMEHNGVEAPYQVVHHIDQNKFSVFDLDDEDSEHPVAAFDDAAAAERLTAAHFYRSERIRNAAALTNIAPNRTATDLAIAAQQREARARALTAAITKRLSAYIPRENYNDFVADLFEFLMEQETEDQTNET